MHNIVSLWIVDKWRFIPGWQKFGGMGFAALVAAVLVPMPEKMLVFTSVLLLFGFWSIFAGVFYFFFALFRKDKSEPVKQE